LLHCPECQRPLVHRQHKIFHDWRCEEGHGTLFPKGELENIIMAITGLGELDLPLWEDHQRYSVVVSSLISPESGEPMLEIRDRDFMNIVVYGDPQTHSLWLHTGEEEKLLEHIERANEADALSSYLALAAREAAKIFNDDEPLLACRIQSADW